MQHVPWKRLPTASVLGTARTFAHFAATPAKASTSVLAALKTSSGAVKSESSFRSCLENVSNRDGIASTMQFWSFSHRTSTQFYCRSKQARLAAMVQQHASKTKSPAFLNLHTMSCSTFTVCCSGRSIVFINITKAASNIISFLLADEEHCSVRSSTLGDCRKSHLSH